MGRSGIPPVQYGAVGGARDRRCLAGPLIGRTGAVETDSGRRDRLGCTRLRGHGGFEATIHPRPLQWRVRTGGGRGAQTSVQRTRRCLDTPRGTVARPGTHERFKPDLGEARSADSQRVGTGPAARLSERTNSRPLAVTGPTGTSDWHAPRTAGRLRVPPPGDR